MTSHTPEASFVEHHFYPMLSERHIAFASQTHIVPFDTHVLTMRATGSLIRSDHFDPQGSISLHLLLEKA